MMIQILLLLLPLLINAQVPFGLEPDGTMPIGKTKKFRWCVVNYRWDRDNSAYSRFDPLFFCTNFPNGVIEKGRKLRRNTPDSKFWMDEPQYSHWNTRYRRDKVRIEGKKQVKIKPEAEGMWHWWSSENKNSHESGKESQGSSGLMYQKEMRDAVKRRGLYFRTEVTAIKDYQDDPAGSIVKGWFHLKITLEKGIGAARVPIDDSLPAEDLQKGKLVDEDVEYLIDRLMVSSRGLALGEGGNNQQQYPSMLYTAGVGEFVQDFPMCKDNTERGFQNPIEDEYVPEQFLWCGAGNGRELLPSNNFIYVRTADPTYGPTSDPNGKLDETRKEIHLNFRLHHSFCNLFYEVDFIVAGIVAKEGTHIKHGNNLHSDWNKLADKNEVFFVQRSLSTRLRFVTDNGPNNPFPGDDKAHTTFKFYESADPTPQVSELDCNIPLTDSISGKLEDVITSAKSPYKDAIKSVVALPPPTDKVAKIFSILTRIDLSYHDLHRMHDIWYSITDPPHTYVVPELGDTDFADVERQKRNVGEEVMEWDKFSGLMYGDSSCRGWSLFEDTTSVTGRCRDDNSIKLKQKSQWTGRCGLQKGACGAGLFSPAAACDAGFFQKNGDYMTTPISLAVKTDKDVFDKVKFFDDQLEPLRIVSLHPMAVNLKKWAEDKAGIIYDEKKGVIYTNKTKEIWFNSTFTLPNFAELDKSCNERNKKILDGGGCPLIPAHPTTGPTEKIHKGWGKSRRIKRLSGEKGMRIDNPAMLYIWDTRVFHSIFLTVLTMFVVPISIFMARYYKETFMNVRVLYHHVWYLVHLVAALMTLSLLLIGMWRQFRSRWWLGVNRKKISTTHRILGWVVIILSFLMFLLGGLRPMHLMARGLVISFHWLFGMLMYIFLVACIMTSIWIPASPSVLKDNSSYELGFMDLITTEAVFMTLVFWILFDIGINIVMSILGFQNDKLLQLSQPRLYLPTMIPVINENFRFDIPGFRVRKIMLAVYIIVATTCTCIICVAVCLNSPVDRGFGIMTCTHKSDGTKYVHYPKNCAKEII